MTVPKIGLLIPTTFSSNPPSLRELQSFAKEAESLGFDSLWTIDRLIHPGYVFDPLATISMLVAVTDRIKFGTSILLTAFRNAVHLAKFLSTLDHLIGGRLILGASLGGRDGEYEASGVSVRQRVARLNENIKVMRMLWNQDVASFKGHFYDLRAVSMNPKPVERAIPIYIGGRAETVLRRAARIADGWIAGASFPPNEFAAVVQKVKKLLDQFGRDQSSFSVVKLLYTWVADDRALAKRVIKKWADAYYQRDYDVERYCAFGNATECGSIIEQFIEAGAETVILGPPSTDLSQIRKIANEVLPHLS